MGSQNVIGIDVGISLLSAENLRTGKVWQWFMSNPAPERALDLAGLIKVRNMLQAPKLVAPGMRRTTEVSTARNNTFPGNGSSVARPRSAAQ